MEEIRELKRNQHHSKVAIYSIVGFLVLLVIVVLSISNRLQSEQALKTVSNAQEFVVQPQPPVHELDACKQYLSQCESFSTNYHYYGPSYSSEYWRLVHWYEVKIGHNCEPLDEDPICSKFLTYIPMLRNPDGPDLCTLIKNGRCMLNNDGCINECESLHAQHDYYLRQEQKFVEELKKIFKERFGINCNIDQDQVCKDMQLYLDHMLAKLQEIESLCKNINSCTEINSKIKPLVPIGDSGPTIAPIITIVPTNTPAETTHQLLTQ